MNFRSVPPPPDPAGFAAPLVLVGATAVAAGTGGSLDAAAIFTRAMQGSRTECYEPRTLRTDKETKHLDPRTFRARDVHERQC